MANISGASLTQIQQRLRDTPAYHPFDADTFCDWAMEAGDIVTVRRGEESYQSPVHSSHLVWRGKQNMELNASGTKERDAIARVSKQKYARGGYGMRQQKSLYYEFYSEDGYLHGLFEVSESHMRSEFEDVANSLRGEFEVTASHLRSEFEDVANGLRGEFEVTASHLRSEFNDTANSLRGEFEVTASHLRGEFNDTANSLRGEFEVTASHLRGEFNDTANSLRGEFEVTASHLRGEFEDANNSLRGEFEVTAASLRAQFEDTSNSLRSSIEAEAGRIGLVVEGYGTDASVKRASLILAINNGTSSAHLDADQVYIGNQKSTTVINGKLEASDITTDLITTKLALADNVNVKRLSLTNNGYIVLPTGDGNISLTGASASDVIKNLRIQLTGNTYTLQKVTLGDASWQDVGSFSRAISSASWEWTNGMPKVTLSPQDQSFTGRQITYGTPYQDSQDNNRWKMEIVEIDSSTTPPRYVTIPGRTIPLWNYLESKTGTAKITSNGTFTPGTGKIGFSSVEVNVDATVTGAWEQSNPQSSANPYNKYTVRKGSGAVALSETVNVTQSYDSTTHKYTATVSATNRSSVITAVTGTDAYTDGQNSVNVNRGTWNGGQITFSPSAGTGATKSVTLSSGSASWSNNTATVTITDTTASQTAYTVTVDASGRYTAGQNSVNCKKGTWSSGKLTVSPSAGTGSSALISLVSSAASWDGNSATVTIWDGTSADAQHGSNTGKSVTIDASARYTAGYDSAHVTGTWSNNTFTYSKTNDSTKPNSASFSIGMRFNSATTGYYVSAYRTVGSSTYDISNATTYYKLGTNSAGTVVQVQDRNGNQIGNTPIYNLPTIGISSTTATVNAGKSVTIYATKNGSNVTSAACTVTARSIGYVTIDDKGNHNGDWWNFKCFTQKGGTLVCEGNTDVANYGMYVPGSSASHTITNFNTGSPSGQSYNAIVNGTEGYMLVGSGNDATAYIVTKSTWNCDGNSKTGVSYLQSAPTLLYKKGYADGGGGGGGTHTPSIEGWDRSDWSVDVNGNIPTGYIKIAETSRHSAGYVFKFKISATADCQGVKQSGSKGYYIVLT